MTKTILYIWEIDFCKECEQGFVDEGDMSHMV